MSDQSRLSLNRSSSAYHTSRRRLGPIVLAAIGFGLAGLLTLAAAPTLRGADKVQPVGMTLSQHHKRTNAHSVAVASMLPISHLVEPVQAVVSSNANPGSQVVNGVSIELTSIKRDGDTVLTDICFQLPSSADWQAGSYADDVVLTTGNESFAMGGGRLIEWRTTAAGAKTFRCDELHFYVPASVDLSDVTLTVKRLITSTPEAMDCGKLQGALTRSATGLTIQCDANDYGATVRIVQKPATMSDGLANRLVDDAGRDIVQGPWSFVTSIP
jgi:hypothetical protein